MTPGTTVIRAVVGPLFVGHGTQKLFGWFGGHGREGTGGYFESLGLTPASGTRPRPAPRRPWAARSSRSAA